MWGECMGDLLRRYKGLGEVDWGGWKMDPANCVNKRDPEYRTCRRSSRL